MIRYFRVGIKRIALERVSWIELEERGTTEEEGLEEKLEGKIKGEEKGSRVNPSCLSLR